MMRLLIPFSFAVLFLFLFSCENGPEPLMTGQELKPSDRYLPGAYQLSSPQMDQPALVLQSNDFIWDGQGTQIIGSTPETDPEEQTGVGILIRDAQNITLRNLEIMGYEVGILARGVQRLRLENCTIHYQKRQLDTLLPQIAGIVLENCSEVIIKNCRIAYNQQGILAKESRMIQLLQDTILGNTQWGLAISQGSEVGVRGCEFSRHFPWGEEWTSSRAPDRGGIRVGPKSRLAENTSNRFTLCTPDIWWEDPVLAAKNLVIDPVDEAPKPMTKSPEQLVLHGAYGPYEFTYPNIWLREQGPQAYIFLLLGPKIGNWKATDGYGWTGINPKTGTFPNTLVAQTADTSSHQLIFEFIGEPFRLPNGHWNKKGAPYPFTYRDPLQ